jgi:hypothetical protein
LFWQVFFLAGELEFGCGVGGQCYCGVPWFSSGRARAIRGRRASN